MYTITENKKSGALKALIIISIIAASAASICATLMIWKKKCCKDKMIEDEIDAAIDAALSEESTSDTEEVIEA